MFQANEIMSNLKNKKNNLTEEEKNKLKITELGEKVILFCYKYFVS